LTAVLRESDHLDVPSSLIDQRDVLDTEIELGVGGSVRRRDQVIDLANVTACYLRRYDRQDLAVIASPSVKRSHISIPSKPTSRERITRPSKSKFSVRPHQSTSFESIYNREVGIKKYSL
jgi:hypothetical protein